MTKSYSLSWKVGHSNSGIYKVSAYYEVEQVGRKNP